MPTWTSPVLARRMHYAPKLTASCGRLTIDPETGSSLAYGRSRRGRNDNGRETERRTLMAGVSGRPGDHVVPPDAGPRRPRQEGPQMPAAHSDRGTQMTSRSTQAFFFDLGIAQSFSRPRTPTDNATCESWMATLKCERLYEADTAEVAPYEVEAMIDRFIEHYNNERLHQGIGFVTPVERHEGRHTAIIAARNEGMRLARENRKMQAYGGTGEGR